MEEIARICTTFMGSASSGAETPGRLTGRRTPARVLPERISHKPTALPAARSASSSFPAELPQPVAPSDVISTDTTAPMSARARPGREVRKRTVYVSELVSSDIDSDDYQPRTKQKGLVRRQ